MSNQTSNHDRSIHAVVRTYRPGDQEAVARLYNEGLFSGQIATNDTGADIENIQDAYFNDPADHFWIAEHEGRVLGMIGVARDGHTAEIRRLRVEKEWQQTSIGSRLVETALAHCRHHGELKVVLDTRFEHDQIMELFTRFGFQHTRTKTLHGTEILEFYVDLYRNTKHDESGRKDTGHKDHGAKDHSASKH